MGCPNGTLATNTSSANGTITFGADGTFTASLGTSGTETLTLPNSCLISVDDAGVESQATCSQFQDTINNAATPNATEQATCMTSDTNCVCNLTVTTPAAPVPGMYSTAAATVNLTSMNGISSSEYCVQGSTLHLLSVAMGASMPASDLVFTKQ
jgi:hypothetical protein